MHLTDDSPESITQGGLNAVDEGYDVEAVDKDGKQRPDSGNPWAIGAYE